MKINRINHDMRRRQFTVSFDIKDRNGEDSVGTIYIAGDDYDTVAYASVPQGDYSQDTPGRPANGIYGQLKDAVDEILKAKVAAGEYTVVCQADVRLRNGIVQERSLLIPDEHYHALLAAAKWMHQKEVETSGLGYKCGPDCPGWFVASSYRGMDENLQRCDECDVFDWDHDAAVYVMTRLIGAMERRHAFEIKQQEKERGEHNTGP